MELLKKEAFKAVGKKVTCSWTELQTEMPRAWQEVTERKDEIKCKTSEDLMDICLQVKDGVFTQLVGAEVRDFSDIPIGFEGVSIPEQQYIYSLYSGDVKDMAAHFEKMQEWASSRNYQFDPLDFKIEQTINNGRLAGLYLKIL
ncbi:GyrI-like domain-containing protein [Peribacillus kribbensis]|uniref:GyrI-like domain-containing protein n=1 Tax=Peribacillus kribbensis TaxID=356658 RepID=UPI0004088196|nr:effector binding domain-containing protein [Peribacillus kribbensis]